MPSAIFGNSQYFPKILQKLGRRLDACHQKMVAGTGARHIKQMQLSAVGVFEVGLVGYAFDARLQRQDFVVTELWPRVGDGVIRRRREFWFHRPAYRL